VITDYDIDSRVPLGSSESEVHERS
jgi:hypothetical protein